MVGITDLFAYETPKLVQISNLKVGITQRLIQLVILGYVICWVMLYEKGYQETDTAKSAVTTKVKGIGFTNYTNISGIGLRSWDIADLVYPALENDAFFVTTNLIVTPQQKLGTCAEIQEVYGSACLIDSDCPVDNLNHIGNGANTGKCIIQPGMSNGTCEIYSWCPLENDTLPLGSEHFMFPMVENFTLLIKNDVTFRKFNVHRRNIQHWVSKRFLRTCHYDKDHPEYKHCPIFKFSTMFKEANIDHSALIHGGVIGIDINWDCDLDWDKKYCVPEYKFSRLDDPDAPIGRGFNFRYAYYYYVDGVLHRDLIKAYGIRFQIHSTGTAGKFHILPLTMNIGSGIALLGLAPVICDIIILNLVGSKKIYQKAKFETIAEEQQLIAARRECKVKPGDLPKSSKKKKKVSTESDSHSQEHPESNANITPSGDQNVVP